MGIQERREREKKQQRQKILDAALQIISKEGFAALSMRKLADRIEYSPASIYLHFESREQIARELSEVGFEELLGALSAGAASQTAVEALGEIGGAYVTYGLKNPELYRLIFMGDSEYMTAAFGKQSEDNAGTRAYKVLLELAARLRSEGVLKHTTQAELADLILTILHGIVSLHVTCVGLQLTSAKKLAKLATDVIAGELNHVPAKPSSTRRTRKP